MFKTLKAKLENQSNYTLYLILFFCFICCVQYFLYPLCRGYDFPYHFNRLYCLYDALKNGTYPNYMDYYVLEGYGYLVKNFYNDFLLLPYALLSFLVSVQRAYNLMLISSTFFCCIICYVSYKSITKDKYGALIFAILYALSSYRLLDLYQRGALGEGLAMTFLPLVFWGMYEILRRDYRRFYILSIGVSLLIYVHTLTTSLVVIGCSIALILNFKYVLKDTIRIRYLFYSVILCLVLSSYSILPYIEMLFADTYKFSNFVNETIQPESFEDVLSGMFRLYDPEYLTFKPKLGAIIIFATIIMRILVSRKNSSVKWGDTFFIIGLILLFLTTNFFPWHFFLFEKLSFLQFTSRFYLIITFLFSFSCAIYSSVFAKTKKRKNILFLVLLSCIILAMKGDSIHYKRFTDCYRSSYADVETGERAVIGAEFLPLDFKGDYSTYTETIAHRGRYTIEYQNESTKIKDVTKHAGEMSFDLKLSPADTLVLPLTYYKGYKVLLNGEELNYCSTDGLITIVPKESGKIETQYIGTSLVFIGLIISLIAYAILVFYICKKRNFNPSIVPNLVD